MKHILNWVGSSSADNLVFPVSVPGNLQNDYAKANLWGDIHYGMNAARYQEIEDVTWTYSSNFEYTPSTERVFFVSGGIDYRYDIHINDFTVYSYEGSYKPIDIDITQFLITGKNKITVCIHPHPKRKDAPVSRTQADHSVKAPVGYGWDWHPRVIPSGIWNDAYLETRPIHQPKVSVPTYTLSSDFSKAYVHFSIEGTENFSISLISPDGSVTESSTADIIVDAPLLWWCNGEGAPNLYTWRFESPSYTTEGRIGFRRIELIMNEGAWHEPNGFPKSRSNPPITIRLNGRRIFAKGSNFVSPEIFPGTSNIGTYEPLVRLAKEANMNILRCWGGSGIQKDVFFSLCDEMGIMIWQEFPLACNAYPDDPHYLKVLESEARSIVTNLRHHPCVVLWCGGNELFNSWSKMTDQSLALRLLNKICLEEDPHTPFISTSPLMGMAHGGYTFLSQDQNNELVEIYEEYNNAHCTAYTEFGCPGMPNPDYLRTFIPHDELFPPKPGGTYELHHGFNAWIKDSWICLDILRHYFGEPKTLEELCEQSSVLQCAGYQAVFEEARRQQPYCSMVINWCYNEPWKTAANNTILSYPAIPKNSYFTVQDSLRSVLPSARLKKFSYKSGEEFSAELWLLNDSQESVSDTVHAYLEFNGEIIHILDWNTPLSDIQTNIKGHTISVTLPKTEQSCLFKLKLITEHHGESSYTLLCKGEKKQDLPVVSTLNL